MNLGLEIDAHLTGHFLLLYFCVMLSFEDKDQILKNFINRNSFFSV